MPAKAKQQQFASESESDDEPMGMGEDTAKYLNKNFSREFMASIPAKIRDRTKLLISLDDEYLKQQAAHDAGLVALKQKYEALFAPLYARRREIVTGEAEATQEEITKGYPEEHKGKVEIEVTAEDGKDSVKGIPQFWLDALRHHVIIDQMISERDAEVLEHLIDITGATIENGFSLTLAFAPNEFMKETVLTKTVYTKKEFGQVAIDRTEETEIHWNDGKNVTVETIEQKQRSKKGGGTRVVKKEQPCDSFFNMFKNHEDQEEAEQWCSLVVTICDKVVPFAVEYVTGEAPDGSSDLDDGEDYYGEEDEDDEEEEDEKPQRGRGGKGASSGKPNGGDCKQQ